MGAARFGSPAVIRGSVEAGSCEGDPVLGIGNPNLSLASGNVLYESPYRRNGRHARSFVTRSRKLNPGGVGGQDGRTRSPVTCPPACECRTKRGTRPARIEHGLVHAQAAFNLDAQEIIECDSHGI